MAPRASAVFCGRDSSIYSPLVRDVTCARAIHDDFSFLFIFFLPLSSSPPATDPLLTQRARWAAAAAAAPARKSFFDD